MVSSHVTRGRRNLAGNTIFLMRHIGMNAFQTVLFPQRTGQNIKRLNHMDKEAILKESIDVKPEIVRAFAVSQPVLDFMKSSIYFAGNLTEVMLNLHQWNEEMKTSPGKEMWGHRTITYFVYDPSSKQFAPSKYCAYIGLQAKAYKLRRPSPMLTDFAMTVALYTSIDDTERKFDGRRARIHLTDRLGMLQKEPGGETDILEHFDRWIAKY